VMPHGELSHGGKGLMEYYMDLFTVSSESAVLGLLQKILAADDYRGHHDCPCGSGWTVRQCHGAILLTLKKIQDQGRFFYDCLHVLEYMKNDGKDISIALTVKRFFALIKKHIKELSAKEKRATSFGKRR